MHLALPNDDEMVLTVDNLALRDVDLIADGYAPRLEGTYRMDRFIVFGASGNPDRAFSMDFDERDMILFSGFEEGTFGQARGDGAGYLVRSMKDLASLQYTDGFSIERGASDGITVHFDLPAGARTMDIQFDADDLAAFNSLLIA